MNKNILIRCDASQSIGLGHITRCLVLANEFKKGGDNISFAIKNNELAIEKIKEQQFDMIIASDDNFDYFKWIVDIIEQQKIDIFIGDIRDGFPIELISYMKSKNILTVAIDEPSDYAKECDICFYPPHAIIDKTKYKGKVYHGLEYVILRPEFYEKFEKVKNKIPNVLVMMGGTDAYNLTLPVIKEIDSYNEEFKISVILSDKHKDIKILNEFIKISNHKINIYKKVDDMSLFLNSIDFAIVQFGTVVYELIIKKIVVKAISFEENYGRYNNFFDKYFVDVYALSNYDLKLFFTKKYKFKKIKIRNCIIETIKKEIINEI